MDLLDWLVVFIYKCSLIRKMTPLDCVVFLCEFGFKRETTLLVPFSCEFTQESNRFNRCS